MVESGGSQAVSDGVRVEVRSRYSPQHSDPAAQTWFFLYTITVTNDGDAPVQLLNRHWIITDATGKVEEVRGPGVVGEQPRLEPGQSFEYTSGCPLKTPFGSMSGSYDMSRPDGSHFAAAIAEFTLREPSAIH
jgi:ApaG protein